MKNNIFAIALTALALSIATGCSSAEGQADAPDAVIFETDLGNDVDDALALAMLHNYVDQGKIRLAAVMLNKKGVEPMMLADIINTYYGHPDIELGTVSEGVTCGNEDSNYAKSVAEMTDQNGNALFPRSHESYDSIPEATKLYRKILASEPDSSVTIISVGFSTNLARLLDSKADEISPLGGRELVAKKVKLLSAMAGSGTDPNTPEYNVYMDAAAAKKVFSSWPGEVVMSPFEVGMAINYPATVIENDSLWPSMPNPVVEAYKCYQPMPYDRPTWDLTSVLYAIEGAESFGLSQPSAVSVGENGTTAFTPDSTATRRYLKVDSIGAANILERLIHLTTFTPRAVLVNK